jgi:hypothetical protein
MLRLVPFGFMFVVGPWQSDLRVLCLITPAGREIVKSIPPPGRPTAAVAV